MQSNPWRSLGRRIVSSAALLLPVWLALQTIATRAEALPTCGDFAATWEARPAAMHFVGCESFAVPPGEGLRATYIVRGIDAARVETFLQQEFGMAPLDFICCFWTPSLTRRSEGSSSQYGSIPNPDDATVFVRVYMHSEETLLLDRQDWRKIEFYVVVEKIWGV